MTAEEIILQYLNEAGRQNTKAAQISIISEMLRDPDVSNCAVEYLQKVKDPSYNYYITLKGLPEPAMGPGGHKGYGMEHMLLLLDAMHDRQISGNEQQVVVADFLYCCAPAIRQLFLWAIERQLPGNIGRSLLNKCLADMIYKQPYGGVAAWDADMVLRRFDFDRGVMLELKEDGMSLMIDVTDATVRTRAGQDVSQQMAKVLTPVYHAFPLDFILHVEAKMWDAKFKRMLPRPKANGEFNAMFQGERQIAGNRIVLTVLDIIPKDVFYSRSKNNQLDAEDRYHLAQDYVNDYNTAKHDLTHGWPEVEIVPMSYVYSLDEARSLCQSWISQGREGAVLKDPHGLWADTKMTCQMKMKNEFECTLMVYGQKAHKKHKGWVGSLLVCSLDGIIKTAVGSGLNEDEDSELCRTDPGAFYNGMLVEVKAEKISKNNALDLPRIMEVRHDKEQADTYEQVLQAYQDSISLG